VEIIAAYPDEDLDALTDPQVLEGLKGAARQQASESRAVAFIADGLLNGSDALLFDAEHREGVALKMMVPYTRHRFPRRVTLDHSQGVLQLGAAQVWASD